MEHAAFIKTQPNSKTAILFIHGILGTPNHFADMLPLVPDNCSIYNILLDGHGKTVDDFADSSMQKWERQVGALLLKLTAEYEHVLIAAHSMGALFAIDAAMRHEQVKALFLLALPLRISVKPRSMITSLKISLDKINAADPVVLAGKKSYSIAPEKRLWKYVKWIPNYISLFRKANEIRHKVSELATPCHIFQSRKDELAALSSIDRLQGNPMVQISVLNHSSHFYYDEDDYATILAAFSHFCDEFAE